MTSHDRISNYIINGEKHLSTNNYALSLSFLNSAITELTGSTHVPSETRLDMLDKICSMLEKSILRTSRSDFKKKLDGVSNYFLLQFPKSPRAYLRRAKAYVLLDRDFDNAIRLLKKSTTKCIFKSDFDQQLYSLISRQIDKLSIERIQHQKIIAKKRDPFEMLSEDIILLIFQYLSFEETLRCLSVSKKWAYFMRHMPVLFRTVDLSKMSKSRKKEIIHDLDDIDKQLNSRSFIGTLKIDKNEDLPLINKFRPSKLIANGCGAKLMVKPYQLRPYLKHLSLVQTVCQTNSTEIFDLLKHYNELNQLEISGAISPLNGNTMTESIPTYKLKSFGFVNQVLNPTIRLTDILAACPELEKLVWRCHRGTSESLQLNMSIVATGGLRSVTIRNCLESITDLRLSKSLKILSVANAEISFENLDDTNLILPLKEVTFHHIRGEQSLLQINRLLAHTDPETLQKLDISFACHAFSDLSNKFWKNILPRFYALKTFILKSCDIKNLRPIAEAKLKSLQTLDITGNFVDRMSLSEFPTIYKQTVGSDRCPDIIQLPLE